MVTIKFWKWSILRPWSWRVFHRAPKNQPEPRRHEEPSWPDFINWKNERKVPAILLQTQEGYTDMKKVINVSGEFLIDPFDPERKLSKKEIIYTGLQAQILNISPDIFPGRLARLIFGFLYSSGLRVRAYHRLYDEPCTRDFYSGRLLRPDKKRKVLIEKGVIDEEGYYLAPKKYNAKGVQTGGGKRLELEDCWVKPDFSDIDFIKSEFHSFKQSEAVVESAKAMKKTGMNYDKWYYLVIIAAIVGMVAVVLITSGVMQQ